MRRLTHLVVLTAFIFTCGGQWGLFQCVAWANMIREYSQVVPITEAVEMTFSGHYPCAICKAIADRTNSEQQKAFLVEKTDKKFLPLLSLEVPGSTGCVPATFVSYSGLLVFRSDSPAVPPPRLTLS